jgi:hypothetical protein
MPARPARFVSRRFGACTGRGGAGVRGFFVAKAV